MANADAAGSAIARMLLLRLGVMARLAETLLVAALVGATIGKADDMVDLYGRLGAATLEAGPTEWLLGENSGAIALTSAAPLASINMAFRPSPLLPGCRLAAEARCLHSH